MSDKTRKGAHLTDRVITMKSGSTFITLTSWKTKVFDDYMQLTAPEDDFSIYFMELAGVQNIEEKVNNAWQKIDPHFNLKPHQASYPPKTDDWENIYQVAYDSPASDSRCVVALARVFNGQSYICLVDGKMASISRRGSELNIMLESWKPIGFKEIQINQNKAKDWTEDDTQHFEKFFSDTMLKFQVPGAAIAIIRKDGKMLYSKGFGVKQLGGNNPVTVDTPFMIGSTTKPLTTLLMAMLIDQKKISWVTPINHILKNFSLADDDLTKKMQIRHTVSASTGMPRRDLDWVFKYKGITPEERLLQMRDMKPTTRFGETFQYSNALVMVGGYATARAYVPDGSLENAYASAMQELVFNPLGMKKTVIKISDALRFGAAYPHGTDFNGQTCQIPLSLEEACYSVAPAGAIWSTADDLSKYLLVEMNNGVLKDKRIVSETALLERRKPGIKMGENASYGLGLMISNEKGFNFIGHDGATLGFSSHLFFLPEKEIGVVILANSSFVHSFFAAVKQKFLELTFSAKPCSEEILNFSLHEREEFIKKKSESVSFDLELMRGIDHLLGEYTSGTLGNAVFAQIKDKYEITFEGWKTEVGIEIDNNEKKLLVLTSPPWSGGFKLRMEDDGKKLVLDCGQEQHDFIRKELVKENSYSCRR